MRAWEVPASSYSETPKAETGIVLGGMLTYDTHFDRIQFFRGTDRLLQAIELYKKGYIKKIFFVGGSGLILHQEQKEAYYVKRYLLELGIPESDLIMETESRNTHENAENAKLILDSLNIHEAQLLITSGVHMRRSLGCFKKALIPVVAYSVDRYCGPRKFEFDHMFLPNAGILLSWDALIHEYIGYVSYALAGYL